MPRFDFECQKCKNIFEGTLPFGSKTLLACPLCKSLKVEKLLVPPMGIVFKGSGFYKTDSVKKEGGKGDTPAAPSLPPEKKEEKKVPPQKPHP